ncbi:T9SS type A sorting domain-containing protein [bacterium]|nr:T9SS type A sorting domain-containing protein [bacterium]
MKGFVPALMLIAFVLVTLTACMDPEPCEVSFITKINGDPKGCTVQAFNAKGIQIQQESTDFNGIGYIKGLAPGTYTFKFTDNSGNYYSAVKTATLRGGESLPIEVDLNEEPPAS